MTPSERDTARAQQIAREFTRKGSASYIVAVDKIQQALAEVRAEYRKAAMCADGWHWAELMAGDRRRCVKCGYEWEAQPAPERREEGT